MKKVAMIGVGKLGQDCAEVMAGHYDVVGYDVVYRSTAFPMCNTIEEAVKDRDFIFIAAPTPHDPIYGGETPTSQLPNKDFDYTIVTDILKEVNKYVNKNQLVVLISTTLPGTVRNILAPCITNARFIYNPYLIAMGTIKWDMVNPEMVIIGTEDGDITGDAHELIDFYKLFMQNNPRYEVGTWDEAESIKIFYNTFISTKVALVNMIQDVAETNGNVNVDVVTQALAKSTTRIMGPAYMTAGMGDGGACHPRDNIALRYLAERLDLGYDLFDSIMTAREVQAERLAKRCLNNGTNITIVGKAYKPNVPYTNGSSSMLVGYYIEKHGGSVNYYDNNTGDYDLKSDWTDVYLIGYWDNYTQSLRFPVKATVIDPWRKMTNDQHAGVIIHYGNTRKKKYLTHTDKVTDKEEYQNLLNNTVEIFPEIIPYLDKIHIIYASTNSSIGFLWRPVEEIVDEIRTQYGNGKTKFIFYNTAETIMYPLLHKAQCVVDICKEIPSENFILTSSAVYAQEKYNSIMKDYGWTRKMTMLSANNFEHSIQSFSKNIENYIESYEIKVKPKKFLCFNKIQRLHRAFLLADMYEANLVDKAFYSFEGTNKDWVKQYESNQSYDSIPNFTKRKQILLQHAADFPLRLNITDDRENPINLLPDDIKYHTDSYFSVVTETIFYHDWKKYHGLCWCTYEDTLFISEKTYKAIIFKHPFIVMGYPGLLKYLRSTGYKTFHPYIDETYDTIDDDEIRYQMIVDEIKRLCNQTDEEWLAWQNNIKNIVEHNYDILKNRKIWHTNIDLDKVFG